MAKRLPKRRPNKNRAPKVVRVARRMAQVYSNFANPLRWNGLVKPSAALRSMCGSNNWW